MKGNLLSLLGQLYDGSVEELVNSVEDSPKESQENDSSPIHTVEATKKRKRGETMRNVLAALQEQLDVPPLEKPEEGRQFYFFFFKNKTRNKPIFSFLKEEMQSLLWYTQDRRLNHTPLLLGVRYFFVSVYSIREL